MELKMGILRYELCSDQGLFIFEAVEDSFLPALCSEPGLGHLVL